MSVLKFGRNSLRDLTTTLKTLYVSLVAILVVDLFDAMSVRSLVLQ